MFWRKKKPYTREIEIVNKLKGKGWEIGDIEDSTLEGWTLLDDGIVYYLYEKWSYISYWGKTYPHFVPVIECEDERGIKFIRSTDVKEVQELWDALKEDERLKKFRKVKKQMTTKKNETSRKKPTNRRKKEQRKKKTRS